MNHSLKFVLSAALLPFSLSACVAAPETPAQAQAQTAPALIAAQTPATTVAGWPARPGPDNTGPTDRSLLKPMDGMTIKEAGTVIENAAITGTVRILADDVTLRNFTIDANGGHYGIQIVEGLKGIKIENGEITNPNSAGILGAGFHAVALNIHESGGDGIKPQGKGGPVIIERCWIHHLGKNPGAHADAIQSLGGDDMTFRHNFFDLESQPTPPYKANTPFMLQNKKGKLSNLLIENNWLKGGGWMLYVPGDAENIRVIGNRFDRDYRFGIIRGLEATTFEGNVWDDNGEPLKFNGDKVINPGHVKPPMKKKEK